MSLVFEYQAARTNGALCTGRIEARSAVEATNRLVALGLSPIEVRRSEVAPPRRAGARRQDLAIAFRSLALLLAAGMPLDRAVGATAPIVSGKLGHLLSEARSQLAEGVPLSGALAFGDGIVPASVTAVLRAGEQAGAVGPALDQLAAQLEQEAELVSRLRQALAYPMVLLLAGLVSLSVIGLVVVPRFGAMLADLGQQLPPAAAFLVSASTWLGRWWALFLGGIALGLGVLFTWVRSPSGREGSHRLLLSIPGIGPFRAAVGAASALRALGAALGAGMPLVHAIAIAGEACNDLALRRRFALATEAVLQGRALASSLAEAQALPKVAIQLIAIGEGSGDLAAMSQRAGTFLAQDVDRRLQVYVRMLEPILIVVLGSLVALVAGALLQAVYSLRPSGL